MSELVDEWMSEWALGRTWRSTAHYDDIFCEQIDLSKAKANDVILMMFKNRFQKNIRS